MPVFDRQNPDCGYRIQPLLRASVFIHVKITQFSQITVEHAVKFASFLKESNIAVSTHNRKIIRLRKIFSTLQSYREESNPFEAKSLRRKPREEQDNVVRRIPFTREEEERLRQMLDDPAYKVMNKSELKTVFYIGLYTGQRLKDAVLTRWDQVDLENRRIFVKQFKTGKEVNPNKFFISISAVKDYSSLSSSSSSSEGGLISSSNC